MGRGWTQGTPLLAAATANRFHSTPPLGASPNSVFPVPCVATLRVRVLHSSSGMRCNTCMPPNCLQTTEND